MSEQGNPQSPPFANPSSPRPARHNSKLHQAAKIRVCDVIAMGGTIDKAAQIVGCTPRAIHYEARRDPEFREKLSVCRTDPRFSSVQTMNEVVQSTKNWRAAYYMLQRLEPIHGNRSPKVVSLRDVRKLADKVFAAIDAASMGEKTRQKLTGQIDKAFWRLRKKADYLDGNVL